MDPSQNSVVLCKLRFFTAYFCAYAAAWFISLACIERYLSSSTDIYKRQFITMKRTYQSIIFVTLLGFLAFGEHAYCININQDLLGAPQSCYQLQQNIQCQIADSLMQFIFEILIPVLMMIVFGFLTLRNIHARYRRISVIPTHNTAVPMTTMRIGNHHSTLQNPRNNKRASKSQPSARQVQRKTQKRDAQLIALLLIQSNATTIAGTGASGTISLSCPTGIMFDADEYLFIVEYGGSRIIGSSFIGFRCIAGCSGPGSSPSQLNNPYSFSFDSYGNIFVADQTNCRIQKFLVSSNSCAETTTSQTTTITTTTMNIIHSTKKTIQLTTSSKVTDTLPITTTSHQNGM
ncbi:unnamed protein product [Adineta steineri]|uniref:Uncharacterized protein n=1 Tax=Adineta steineri TaxID=433720 RepID=A0A813XBJ6_9BILA|nr:unnamed protein product [Adineta steineri]